MKYPFMIGCVDIAISFHMIYGWDTVAEWDVLYIGEKK